MHHIMCKWTRPPSSIVKPLKFPQTSDSRSGSYSPIGYLILCFTASSVTVCSKLFPSVVCNITFLISLLSSLSCHHRSMFHNRSRLLYWSVTLSLVDSLWHTGNICSVLQPALTNCHQSMVCFVFTNQSASPNSIEWFIINKVIGHLH